MKNRFRNDQSQQVVERFYTAYYYLYEMGRMESVVDFCKRVGVDRGAFYKQKLEPNLRIMDLDWLSILAEKGISSDWLLMGIGEMIKK